ncbi:MAG: histidine ammonia-lyase [Thermofilum sp.]|jgi:histidine ammonia-lyase|nr:histidine ammonia-lyase [Thermofilum sp.]
MTDAELNCKRSVEIDGEHLTIEDIVSVARNKCSVKLSEKAKKNVQKSREVVDTFSREGRKIYGVTTGVGAFKDVFLSPQQIEEFQANLVKSHSSGVGNPLPEEIVRAAMLLRANSLAKGYSGVRVEVIETLCEMINKGVHPVVPEKGSVGASGDLAPLAHITLVMTGEGEAFYRGERMSGGDAMRKAGIKPIALSAKEGLALINGTAVTTAIGVLALYDAENVLKCADIAAAMTLEALCGIEKAFDEKIHKLRPYPGQAKCAENIRRLIKNSGILSCEKCRDSQYKRVQDAYSLRCVPQVHGAARDAVDYVRKILEIEINSVTDNPLVFTDPPEVLSGGNFHGQPIAIAMDLLGIALATVGNISERRIARILDPHLNEGLPAFLVPKEKGGLCSGYMLAQYTAAALVSENKVLAHPASVDSIPTSANQEDHVSMSTLAARKAREIIKNVECIIAIELLCAAQGMYFRIKEYGVHAGEGTQAAYDCLREHGIHPLEEDRKIYEDIEKVCKLVHTGELVKAVENKVGKLN